MPLGKAARLPRNHGVGAVVLAAARGRAAAAARALGRCLRVGDALLCGCGGRAAAEPPARVPGARGRTPWRRCGPRRVPKAAGDPEGRCTIDDRSRKQDWRRFGGFFAVFAVAIWRCGKRLNFNVENSASAPWLLSARQKLA